MEPEALKSFLNASAGSPPDSTGLVMMSIAISLKRIADEICGVPYDSASGADNSKHRLSLTEGIQNAIEQGAVAIIHSAR